MSMGYPSFIVIFILGVVCSFCGQDFVSLGRHQWRCKQRVRHAEQGDNEQGPYHHGPNISNVKCCCGKVCKGNRGLKMHQRSCRVISSLNNQLRADLNDITSQDNITENTEVPLLQPDNYSFPDIKMGINLPKKDDQWSTANEFFKSVLLLNLPITVQNINESITLLNNTIYDYFSSTYGHVSQAVNENIVTKYKEMIP